MANFDLSLGGLFCLFFASYLVLALLKPEWFD